MNPTVAEIVKMFLEEHGYDGLYDPDSIDGCGCKGESLFCCDVEDACSCECQAGYLKTDEQGDWSIQAEQPPRATPLPTVAEVTGLEGA